MKNERRNFSEKTPQSRQIDTKIVETIEPMAPADEKTLKNAQKPPFSLENDGFWANICQFCSKKLKSPKMAPKTLEKPRQT